MDTETFNTISVNDKLPTLQVSNENHIWILKVDPDGRLRCNTEAFPEYSPGDFAYEVAKRINDGLYIDLVRENNQLRWQIADMEGEISVLKRKGGF